MILKKLSTQVPPKLLAALEKQTKGRAKMQTLITAALLSYHHSDSELQEFYWHWARDLFDDLGSIDKPDSHLTDPREKTE